MKKTVEVEIIEGQYCRNQEGDFCSFFWESEDGDTGCCLLDKSVFIEGDISNVPKFAECPSIASHPAPTPDLLLTDEDIRELPYIKMLLNREDKAKRDFTANVLYQHEANESGLLVSTALVVARQVAQAQLSKLQQARPEQAREKIIDTILRQHNLLRPSYTTKEVYELADQILQLLPFPDEQGIRSDERRKVKDRIHSAWREAETTQKFTNLILRETFWEHSGKAPGESPLSKGQEKQ